MAMLYAIGLNHSQAPLELRERVAYTGETRWQALAALTLDYAEAVVLDTCNRGELYIFDDRDDLAPSLQNFLVEFHQLPPDSLSPYLVTLKDREAAQHLCAVASGIDSLAVGEAQIMAQVHGAFAFATAQGACGPILSALFRQALSAGKRARSETAIGRGATSLGSLAIERARESMGTLDGRIALVIGAGCMSTLAARALQSAGVETVRVANRTLARGQALANGMGAEAISFAQIAGALREADIVVTATAAPHVILSHAVVASAMAERNKPLCLVDLALPRDVDPDIAVIPGVRLIDLDGLRSSAELSLAQRRGEVSRVRAIVMEESETFWRWLQTRRLAPTITALRRHAEQVRQSELADHKGRLQKLSAQERKAVESMTASIVGRLLHEPIVRLKARAGAGDGDGFAAMLRELFALDECDES
jgi:glutamyl-tRNA reductase